MVGGRALIMVGGMRRAMNMGTQLLACEVAELVGVLVAETIHPACMCEGGGRGGEGGGRAMGPENAVGEWARRRKGE